ncbi:MAG: hypothetical protein ABH840_00970 [Nanoarchaeota archaeon]
MGKRVFLIFALSLILSSCFVSAYTFPINDLRTTGDNVIRVLGDSFSPILSFFLGVDSFDKYFFQRSLLLILLFIVIYAILKRIEMFRTNKTILFLVASIVAILGARYMSDVGIIEAAMLPYGVLGISITVFLPFLIYFFFVYQSVPGTTGRRLAWIVFGLVFLALWASRSSEIGEVGWVYLAGIGLAIVAIFLDPTIKRYFGLHELRRATAHLNDAERVRLLNSYNSALSVYNRTGDTAARREVERLARQLHITAGEEFGNGSSI